MSPEPGGLQPQHPDLQLDQVHLRQRQEVHRRRLRDRALSLGGRGRLQPRSATGATEEEGRTEGERSVLPGERSEQRHERELRIFSFSVSLSHCPPQLCGLVFFFSLRCSPDLCPFSPLCHAPFVYFLIPPSPSCSPSLFLPPLPSVCPAPCFPLSCSLSPSPLCCVLVLAVSLGFFCPVPSLGFFVLYPSVLLPDTVFSHSVSVPQPNAGFFPSPSICPAAHPRLLPLHLCPAPCLFIFACLSLCSTSLSLFSPSGSPCLAPCTSLSLTSCVLLLVLLFPLPIPHPSSHLSFFSFSPSAPTHLSLPLSCSLPPQLSLPLPVLLLPALCFLSLSLSPAFCPCFFCLYFSVLLPVCSILAILPHAAGSPFSPFLLSPAPRPFLSLSCSPLLFLFSLLGLFVQI
ncbi:uncharacterized protein O3Q21_007477 isoform 1-T2 [Podargus strigoides]